MRDAGRFHDDDRFARERAVLFEAKLVLAGLDCFGGVEGAGDEAGEALPSHDAPDLAEG